MFEIGYVYSSLLPLLGDAAWELSHRPAMLFVPVAASRARRPQRVSPELDYRE